MHIPRRDFLPVVYHSLPTYVYADELGVVSSERSCLCSRNGLRWLLLIVYRYSIRLPQVVRHTCTQVVDRKVVEEVAFYETSDIESYQSAENSTCYSCAIRTYTS